MPIWNRHHWLIDDVYTDSVPARSQSHHRLHVLVGRRDAGDAGGRVLTAGRIQGRLDARRHADPTLAGPVGAGKSQRARRMLAGGGDADLVVDFTAAVRGARGATNGTRRASIQSGPRIRTPCCRWCTRRGRSWSRRDCGGAFGCCAQAQARRTRTRDRATAKRHGAAVPRDHSRPRRGRDPGAAVGP